MATAGLVFLGVLGACLVFEGAWYVVHGTNAVSLRSTKFLAAVVTGAVVGS